MKMDEPTQRDHKRRQFRKRTELSLAIPILAIFLLVSPLLNGFVRADGTPQLSAVMIYIFGIWGALVLAAFIMSRLLSKDATNDEC